MSPILLSSAGTLLADSDTGKGSPIGLLVVLILVIAVYFLYRSMNRHLRKVPGNFSPPEPPAGDSSGDGSAGSPDEPDQGR